MTQEEQQLSERIQELQNRERKKKLGEMDISRILQTHARIIRDISEYDLSDYCEFDHHCALIEKLGDNYMGREFREFCVDNYSGVQVFATKGSVTIQYKDVSGKNKPTQTSTTIKEGEIVEVAAKYTAAG